MTEKLMSIDEVWGREISQREIDHAPCITFAQVRALAAKQGMTLDALVARFRGEVEETRKVFTRVLDNRFGTVVMPYRAVIAWYQQATTPLLAHQGERTCACGCEARVRGRRKWASPGCRQRAYRRARMGGKLGAAA